MNKFDHCNCNCRVENRIKVTNRLTVDCSNSKCTCIPYDQIPSETTNLILDRNLLRILKDYSFRNLSTLFSLSVKKNHIRTIQSKAFHGLVKLQRLDLTLNMLQRFPDCVFSPLENLEILQLENISGRCGIFNAAAFCNLTKLKTFDFSKNKEFKFPSFLLDRRSVTENMVVLTMSYNSIKVLERKNFEGIKSVQELNLEFNQIQSIQGYCFHGMKRLRELRLSGNNLGFFPGNRQSSAAFVSNSLQSLYLDNSNLQLKNSAKLMFSRLPHLTKLVLNTCVFSNSLDYHILFRNLTKLRYLYLRYCRLSPEDISSLLGNLTNIEELDLSFNNLISLPEVTFDPMSGSLRSLRLRGNRITSINRESFPENIWIGLKMIDLRDNPWNCGCNLIWFRKWLNTTTINVVARLNPEEFQCSGGELGKKVPLVYTKHPTELECFQVQQDLCTLLVSVCVIAVDILVVLVTVLYRFRWYVRYYHFIYKVSYWVIWTNMLKIYFINEWFLRSVCWIKT